MPSGASWSSSGRPLPARLLALSDSLKVSSPERRAMEQGIEKDVRDGMTAALLAGKDEQGREFAPLRPSTLEARRRKGIQGTTPFITKGGASGVIASLAFAWESAAGNARILTTRWTGRMAEILRYHAAGAGPLPVRKPGIPPETIRKVRDRMSRYAEQVRAKLRG